MERRRETEKGPSAVIQTKQGAQLEITNLTRYGHPAIWRGKSLNIELKEISEKYRSRDRPHKLLAIAQINGEMEDGKPKYRKLGTVSQQSVADYNLKPGMVTAGAFLKEIKPEMSRGQTSLLFQQAYQSAEAFRASVPESERLSAAAAAWSISATRQDEVEQKQDVQKKVSNFAFAAFPDEIVSRLGELQFTDMKLVTLDNEANNFKGKVWNPDEKYPVEIRGSHHPQDHERHGSRLVFVQDSDGEYKEFAMLEPRTGQLPIGTKAQANIVPGETYTATGTIQLPGKPPVEFTIREISKFSYSGQEFHVQPASLAIGTVPVPNQAVKIQLDGKTLGELDADSVKQLEQINYLKHGNQLNLKFTPIGDDNKTTTLIGESPQGNLLKINKVDIYDFQKELFTDRDYKKVTLEIPQSKTRPAVFLDGQPLGVLHKNKDKEALKELGVLQFGKLTEVPATLQSNFSHTFVKIDTTTIEYPQTWTKERQVFPDNSVVIPQQEMIEKSAPLLQKIKERPTILFTTPEDKMLGIMGMAIDEHKVETVTRWLEKQDITFAQIPAQQVPRETKKGLAVFNLVTASIPEQAAEAMTKKFGEVIESVDEYQQKVQSLPNRPQKLNNLKLDSDTSKIENSDKLDLPKTQTSFQENTTPDAVNREPVTIDKLRDWYTAAEKLAKPEQYKQRIVEVANQFKSGQQLSDKALAAMEKDTQEYQSISRLTQIAQRIGAVLGKPRADGYTHAQGKMYDLIFNAERKDLTIAYKSGEVILNLQSGNVQSNKVTPEILQAFDKANASLDESETSQNNQIER